jgi:3-oxoadipate enol-lactonase
MAFAHLSQVTLHYEWTGPEDAAVLILSHSLGASMEIWASLPTSLRILRYDTRGHGLSSTPAGDYSLTNLGGDVIELLDLLGIEKAHFCGVSLGGMTGLWLAMHAPHRISSLMVADTAARIGTRESWTARTAQVSAEGLASIVEGTLARWYTEQFRASHPEQVEKTRRIFLTTSADGYANCCAAIRDADLTAAVGSIDLPTLVMTGADDPVTPVTDGRFLQKEIAGSRFVQLRGAHLAHVEDAAGFNQNVSQFVDLLGR